MNGVATFCDFIQAWLEANAARLRWTRARFSRDAELGTIAAGYEHLDCPFSVSGWENGCCLDIDVLTRSTGASHIVGAGPCANRDAAVERLESAAKWIALHGRV